MKIHKLTVIPWKKIGSFVKIECCAPQNMKKTPFSKKIEIWPTSTRFLKLKISPYSFSTPIGFVRLWKCCPYIVVRSFYAFWFKRYSISKNQRFLPTFPHTRLPPVCLPVEIKIFFFKNLFLISQGSLSINKKDELGPFRYWNKNDCCPNHGDLTKIAQAF